MQPRHSYRSISLLAVVCLLLLGACDIVPGPGPATPTLAPTVPAPANTSTATTILVQENTPTATLTQIISTLEPSPTRTAEPTSTMLRLPTVTSVPPKPTVPTDTPTPRTAGQPGLREIATGFGSPDDLFVMSSGDILFGDFGNKAVNILRAGSTKPVVLAGGFNEPEGIVVTLDGAIIVAEQGTNRIIEVDPTTGAKKLLRQLVNNTGKDGVDGLGLDPATGDILVPDSPNGRLLRLSRDGAKLQTIAEGFVRPTGAAVEPGGSIVVADEFGNAVYRFSTGGKRTLLASMYQPDDVVVGKDGSIYANSLGGEIVRIDPVSKKMLVLTSGLKLPHGLGIAPDGSLVIAEAGRNRILSIGP